jgi:hypothetical protein|tara:strand:+ start:32 stop:172 length:141 start_codon:yes stop_codon:yes gene_type:complete
MSRYEHIPKEQKPPKKPQKELTKPGQYSKEQLEKAAKIYSPIGGKY